LVDVEADSILTHSRNDAGELMSWYGAATFLSVFIMVVGYTTAPSASPQPHRHGPAVRLAEVAAWERFPRSTRALARNQIGAFFSFFASVYCCDFRGQCPEATGFRQSLFVRCGSYWFSHCKRRGLKLNVFFALLFDAPLSFVRSTPRPHRRPRAPSVRSTGGVALQPITQTLAASG
jgi:hypothetical protein